MITTKDKIFAYVVIDMIMDAMNYNLYASGYESNNKTFTVENAIDSEPINHFETLYNAVEETSLKIKNQFIDSFYRRLDDEIDKEDWDRMCVILLEKSDFFNEVLKNTNAAFVIEHADEIKKFADSNTVNEITKYLVDKSIALKVIGSQSAYQMCEYNESIFLSDYNTYESVDIMLKDIEYAHGDKYYHLGDTTTPWCYYNGESPEYCFNKYNSYWEIIKTQLLQIEEDINDIGMNDMYLSAVELDYLGVVYPDRFKVVRLDCDDWETYAIKDTKTDEYIVDANGDYINGYFTDINTVATDLNVGGWY